VAALTLPARLQALARSEVPRVERQPFAAQVRRVVAALNQLGAPLKGADLEELEQALASPNDTQAVVGAVRVLDAYSLIHAMINPEGRVSAVRGSAPAELVERGWRVFLVKVLNEGAVTAQLTIASPQARASSTHTAGSSYNGMTVIPREAARPSVHTITERDVAERWLELATFDSLPLTTTLSGLAVEYRIVQLYARDHGLREATLTVSTGPTTIDLGGRSDVPLLFRCLQAATVLLRVRDWDGTPTMASLTVRDLAGRVYPARGKRLAPDFPFQTQVYRADGETLPLPAGTYIVEASRGPEYIAVRTSLAVERTLTPQPATFQLVRWIDPAAEGWYSGDHHIHAAGCSHYNTPTEGVEPSVIARHVRGEGLRLGEILSWGGSWYYQKQFFSGHPDQASARDALLRYDVEVSGFPSSHAGHLVLLGLTEQDYPGTKQIEDWPTWTLPILRWAKAQGAVVGYAHTGDGLQSYSTTALPNMDMPPFNDCAAKEYPMSVTHEVQGESVVDFLSAMDTPVLAELNPWYHTLNVGFRTRIGGETDFPCLFETVGVGRSYVHLDAPLVGDAGYQAWIAGLKAGRSYVSEGRSHLMDFAVNNVAVGVSRSELALAGPATVRVAARAAALLEPSTTAETERIRALPLTRSPYWHTERARIGNTRTVPVECVINGVAVATQPLTADGGIRSVTFEVPIQRSSWIALRIFPAAHTNPIFVAVAGKPIRALRRSAEWCMQCVDLSWEKLSPNMSPADRVPAEAAYEHARQTYRKRMTECEVE
jgi:hypothetical protein